MKINTIMALVALAFFTIIGILVAEYYTNINAIDAGLQQCVVNVDGKNQVIWTQECEE